MNIVNCSIGKVVEDLGEGWTIRCNDIFGREFGLFYRDDITAFVNPTYGVQIQNRSGRYTPPDHLKKLSKYLKRDN
jgi:hypothetical protein